MCKGPEACLVCLRNKEASQSVWRRSAGGSVMRAEVSRVQTCRNSVLQQENNLHFIS